MKFVIFGLALLCCLSSKVIAAKTYQIDDMILTERQYQTYMGLTSSGMIDRVSAARKYYTKWRRAYGRITVPLQFDAEFTEAEQDIVWAATKQIESQTCVQFVEKNSSHVDYIQVVNGAGCSSSLGRIGGMQQLSLNKTQGCVDAGVIRHELLHALGICHTQSRVDRDTYVQINLENVKAGKEHNFLKVRSDEYSTFGTPYDFLSIMHYGKTFFQKEPELYTVVAKAPYENMTDIIGIADDLSPGDITRINRMHNCPRTITGETVTVWKRSPPTPCKWVESLKDQADPPVHVKYLCYVPANVTYAAAKTLCTDNGMTIFSNSADVSSSFSRIFSKMDLGVEKIYYSHDDPTYCRWLGGVSFSYGNGSFCTQLRSYFCEKP